MIEWIVVIMAVCLAACYVVYKMWKWSSAKSCGGCGDQSAKVSSSKQQITIGGKSLKHHKLL